MKKTLSLFLALIMAAAVLPMGVIALPVEPAEPPVQDEAEPAEPPATEPAEEPTADVAPSEDTGEDVLG